MIDLFIYGSGLNGAVFYIIERVKPSDVSNPRVPPDQDGNVDAGRPDFEEHSESDEEPPVEEEIMEEDFQKFTGRKKKLWELRQKMVSFYGTPKIFSA